VTAWDFDVVFTCSVFVAAFTGAFFVAAAVCPYVTAARKTTANTNANFFILIWVLIKHLLMPQSKNEILE
jgi:asparagine N-glycosylation enzyme membrane subunit Stt3